LLHGSSISVDVSDVRIAIKGNS